MTEYLPVHTVAEWELAYQRQGTEIAQLKARVGVLTAALTEIADEADPCTDELRARHFFVDCPVCTARAALATAPAPEIPLNEHGEVPLSYIFGETETEEKP